MKRQQFRKLLITISLLLFPITLYYFSPALIIEAALKGIINGSFIIFILMFVLSIPFGRIFCAYLCPGGGLQECAFTINDKNPKQGWKNKIKYIIWIIWISIVIFCYFKNENTIAVDFLFETENGISVSSIQSYVIYYGIICLIFIPSVLFGKRIFCHYFCWMAPFMILGIKVRGFLKLPGLHITVKEKNSCISCGKCSKICPMGIDVLNKIQKEKFQDVECIQCGACVDNCPKKVLSYTFKLKGDYNGDRKKA